MKNKQVMGYSGLSVEAKQIRVRGRSNGLRKGWYLRDGLPVEGTFEQRAE